MKRPRTCPDLTCTQLCIRGDDEYADRGGSYFCWGRLESECLLKYKEVEHRNMYSMCVCTPFKGIIRLFIDPNDALIMKMGVGAVLKDYRSSLPKSEARKEHKEDTS